MNKIIVGILLVFLSTAVFAYSDADMDGVANNVDKCPNTPLTDLVDINGCPKTSLLSKKSQSHYDIIVGANYAGSNFASLNQSNTYSTSIQVDYYYKKISLQASTSYYKTKSSGYSASGMNDSFVGMAYTMTPTRNLILRAGIGALLPTYKTSLNNNKTDYSASANLSYNIDKISLFSSYIYTKINDSDVAGIVTYQNTNAYSVGLGYYLTNSFYLSGSYNSANSIYQGIQDVRTTSIYAYKAIDKNWFMTFFYAYGLSNSASNNASSIKLGYYF